MKKTDIIVNLSNKSDLSKTDAKFCVELILASLTQSIVSGKGAEIRGFGSFHKKHRKARFGFNPKTGESVQIQAKFLPFFKPGKPLREAVDKVNTKTF